MRPTFIKKIPFYFSCLLCVVILSSCSILNHYSVSTYNTSLANAPFDVVIVPGLPYDSSKINPLFKARLLWAKELYENGITKHIIFSGSAVHSPYIESLIMKMMADSMGIPTHQTFVEDKALHSNENVSYGVALADKMGFQKIAIATDPIQSLVIKKYTKDKHKNVSILPFSIKSMPLYYKGTLPKVNEENAYVCDFIPLRERENLQIPMED